MPPALTDIISSVVVKPTDEAGFSKLLGGWFGFYPPFVWKTGGDVWRIAQEKSPPRGTVPRFDHEDALLVAWRGEEVQSGKDQLAHELTHNGQGSIPWTLWRDMPDFPLRNAVILALCAGETGLATPLFLDEDCNEIPGAWKDLCAYGRPGLETSSMDVFARTGFQGNPLEEDQIEAGDPGEVDDLEVTVAEEKTIARETIAAVHCTGRWIEVWFTHAWNESFNDDGKRCYDWSNKQGSFFEALPDELFDRVSNHGYRGLVITLEKKAPNPNWELVSIEEGMDPPDDVPLLIHETFRLQGVTVGKIYRHRARGTTYRVVAIGTFQGNCIYDMAKSVWYVCIEDGSKWDRPYDEFVDGRFEEIEG